MTDKDKAIKLFSLNSNLELAQKISTTSGIPLGKISSKQFSDGEIQINIEESVRQLHTNFLGDFNHVAKSSYLDSLMTLIHPFNKIIHSFTKHLLRHTLCQVCTRGSFQ